MTAIPEQPTAWSVGDQIRKARRRAGLEQAELAEAIGVARSTISGWENDHSEPTVSQARKIAIATGASWVLGKGEGTIFTYVPDLAIVSDCQLQLPFPLPPTRNGPVLALV